MKTLWSKLPGFFGRIVSGTAALTFCCLPALGQSSPPMMVQVPFVNVAAGDITVSGADSTSMSSSCTTGLPTMGASKTGSPTGGDYGDGCPANEVGVDTPWGTAVDAWGNIYFSDEGHLYVRVIYAGAVTANGVANPATAMIEAANVSGASLTTETVTPVAGDVYAIAGGYTAAISDKNSDLNFACNNVTDGSGPDTLNGSADGNGCPATYSYLGAPYGPAVDSEGNVFIVDKSKSLIYVVIANAGTTTAPSLVSQLVELEYPTVFTAGCTATSCPTLPSVGSIYEIVGSGGGYVDGVLGTAAEVHGPDSLTVDAYENVYITDGNGSSDDTTNSAVRMLNGPNTTSGGVGPGYFHTIAGDCISTGCTALAAAPASGQSALTSAFLQPMGIVVDGSGNVYVGDNTVGTAIPSTVRVIYAGGANNQAANLICIEQGISSSSCSSTLVAGDVYTIAGNGNAGNSGKGDGTLATASTVAFDKIQGLALDSHGNVYIADYGSHSVISEVNASTGLLTYLAGDGQTTFGAGDYCAGSTAAIGPTMTDSYGDGCPAPQSITDHIEGNLAFDASGNIYFTDNGDNLLRKLTFNASGSYGGSFPPTAVNTSAAAAQDLAFELLAGDSSSGTEAASNVSVSVVTQGNSSAPDFVNAGTTNGDTCSQATTLALTSMYNASTDTTNTVCIVPIYFTPAHAGARSGAVQISGTVGSYTGILTTAYLSGVGNGSLLTIDPGVPTTSNAGTTPLGVAVDDATIPNTYADWANGALSTAPSGPYNTTIATGLSSTPSQIAIDGAGNVYVADAGNDRIAEYVGGATSPIAVVSGLSAPMGIAVDASGNLYIADTGNGRVLFQPNGNGEQMVLGSGFETPVAVAVDADNNVYVADSGLGEIVKIAANNGAQTTVASGIAPVSLAVDAGGNIQYADSALKEIIEIPASGADSVVASGLTTPTGVAVDTNGGVYVADSANTFINYYSRDNPMYDFASLSDTYSATLTNVGNVAYSEPFTQSDATDFTVVGSAGNGCTFASPLALSAGTNCGLTATFTPVNSGSLTNSVSFDGGNDVLVLSGYNAGTAVATTTSFGSLIPAAPNYGDTISIEANVVQASGSNMPTGTVSFTVDGSTIGPYSLTDGTYAFTLPAYLSAGSHTISAAYTPSGSFTASSTGTPLSFTVAQYALTAIAATVPPVTYGQAIPTISGSLSAVLNSDNVTAIFTTTAVAGSPVNGGTGYPISVSLGGTAAANYTVTLAGTPTVVIQQATVNVTVNSTSKVYGAANPSFSGTLSNVYGTDPVSVNYSTTATQYSAVNGGPYSITASGLNLSGSATGNYILGTITPGTLTITPLAITASVTSPVDVIYGSAIPALSGSLTGVVNGDSVTAAFTTTAAMGDSVGNYPITLAATPLIGSAAANYNVTLSGSPMVTIQPLAITAEANSESVAYGLAIPALSGSLTGVLPADTSNVTAVFTTSAVMGDSVASYPITLAATPLAGSAAGNYTVTLSGAAAVNITLAATTTALTEQATSVGVGSQASFTATVTSPGGTPTGSVIFTEGSTTLCTSTLTSGAATCSYGSLPVGSDSVTAAYLVSTNFAASTSSPVTETITEPEVTGVPTGASTVTIAGGATGTVTLTITAQGGYTGTATFGCGPLPANMSCSFVPPTATFTATNTTATTVLTISTKASTLAMLSPRRAPGQRTPMSLTLAGVLLPGALIGLLGIAKSRKRWMRGLMLVVLLVGGMAGMAAISGCGGSSGAAQTAAGTYNINVTITAGSVTTIPLTVVVQ